MKEAEIKNIERLNLLIKYFIKAEALWQENKECFIGVSFENYPTNFQLFQATFGQTDFFVGVSRLVDYARKYGGFDQFLVNTANFRKEKKKED